MAIDKPPFHRYARCSHRFGKNRIDLYSWLSSEHRYTTAFPSRIWYLAARQQGYALEIDNTFGMSVSNAQKHLERMERDELLVSDKVGRTRVFLLSPPVATA